MFSAFFATLAGSSKASKCNCLLTTFSISTVLPNKSVWAAWCTGAAVLAWVLATLNSSPKTLRPRVLNSSSANKGSSTLRSGSSINKLCGSRATGASKIMVASFLESRPCCAKFSTFSRILPFNSWLWAMIFSIEPYCLISSLAVFSPMPGMPGMLSTASPQRPKISITWSIRSISHLANTSFTPIISTSLPIRAGL